MRNKRIMRIVCLFMAALILVSSIVIVVSADTNGSGSASIEDFKTQMSTISYDDYMDIPPSVRGRLLLSSTIANMGKNTGS